MDCINLKKRFGTRYRTAHEESYIADHGKDARVEDPWLQILLCRHGHIFPQGGELLVASTAKRGPIATKLSELGCTTILQDGDDGLNAVFHVDDFQEVAAVLIPRRRRRLSEKERYRVAEMGRINLDRFRQANVGSPEKEQQSRDRPRDEPGAMSDDLVATEAALTS